MTWIKTFDHQFYNLNFFEKFSAYNLTNDEHFFGVKLVLQKEDGEEVVVGFFKDIEDASDYVEICLNSKGISLSTRRDSLSDLVRVLHNDDYPVWNSDTESYEKYASRVVKFVESLCIEEEECSFEVE